MIEEQRPPLIRRLSLASLPQLPQITRHICLEGWSHIGERGRPAEPGSKNPKFVTTLCVADRRPGGFRVDRFHHWFSGS